MSNMCGYQMLCPLYNIYIAIDKYLYAVTSLLYTENSMIVNRYINIMYMIVYSL